MKWFIKIILLLFITNGVGQNTYKKVANSAIYTNEIKIIPELNLSNNNSDVKKEDLMELADSFLHLSFHQIWIDSFAFDTLYVLDNSLTDTLLDQDKIVVLEYKNKKFDSLYNDIQPGPFIQLYISEENHTISSTDFSIRNYKPFEFLSQTQMRKAIKNAYPDIDFELNEKGEIKLYFGMTSRINMQTGKHNRVPEQIFIDNNEGIFRYGVINHPTSYDTYTYYFDARTGQFLYRNYDTILETD